MQICIQQWIALLSTIPQIISCKWHCRIFLRGADLGNMSVCTIPVLSNKDYPNKYGVILATKYQFRFSSTLYIEDVQDATNCAPTRRCKLLFCPRGSAVCWYYPCYCIGDRSCGDNLSCFVINSTYV